MSLGGNDLKLYLFNNEGGYNRKRYVPFSLSLVILTQSLLSSLHLVLILTVLSLTLFVLSQILIISLSITTSYNLNRISHLIILPSSNINLLILPFSNTK